MLKDERKETEQLRALVDNWLIAAKKLNSLSEELVSIYTVSQKNHTDVAPCDFNALQLILVIYGRDVAKRVCYRTVICYSTCPN